MSDKNELSYLVDKDEIGDFVIKMTHPKKVQVVYWGAVQNELLEGETLSFSTCAFKTIADANRHPFRTLQTAMSCALLLGMGTKNLNFEVVNLRPQPSAAAQSLN
jgi:hypothetical protein